MDKQERNKAIEKVRELYKSYRLIEGLEREIGEYTKLMEYKIREQKELKNLHIDAEEGFCISYEEKVCCSPDNTSKVEKQIEKYISNLKEAELECRKQINIRRDKIAEIKLEYGNIKENIDTLGDFEREIIEMLCRDKKSIPYIANVRFGGVNDTAYRKVYEILDEIMVFENWRG